MTIGQRTFIILYVAINYRHVGAVACSQANEAWRAVNAYLKGRTL